MDIDAGPLPIIDGGINETFRQTSLELRWASPAGAKFDYILGFYGHDSDLLNHQPNVFDPTLSTDPGAFGFDQVFTTGSFENGSRLWSLFATATWKISDQFRLSGGARYVDENKDYWRSATCVPIRDGVIDFDPGPEDQALFETYSAEFFCGTLDGFSDNRDSTSFLPEVVITWDRGQDTMWYAKYSQSAKSGGFAGALIVAPEAIEYDEEESLGFELGRRSRIAGGRAEFNFALFRTDFDNLQVNAFDPVTGVGVITNAADARTQGIELDGGWLVKRYLTLRAALAYLDAKYVSFPNAPCPISSTLAGAEPPCDASGKSLPRAPEFSGSQSADLDYRIAPGVRFLAGLNLGYTDEYLVDSALESALKQDAYVSVGAHVGFESPNGHWTLALAGTNLTNEPILNDALPFLGNAGYIQSPRRIWLRLGYRLGAQ
jgi:iron complex outermembrane receptor protein